MVYASLSKYEETFAWLEKSFEDSNDVLPTIQLLPVFDPIRADSRYARIVQRLGFPLDAVRGSLASGAGVPHELILQKLQDRLTEIDTMQAALAAQRQQVASMLATLQQSWAAGECLELEVLAQPLAALPSSVSKRRKGQAGG